MVDAVICDWNGTISSKTYDNKFFEDLALKSIMKFPDCINLFKVTKFIKDSRECKQLFKQRRTDGKNSEDEKVKLIISFLNERFFKGIALKEVRKVVDNYSEKTRGGLDKMLLDVIFEVKKKKNFLLGIMSSGYYDIIKTTLDKEGYFFDFICANNFDTNNGKIDRFSLEVFSNKGEILKDILAKKKISLDKTVYIGDNWQDEECFRLIRYPIVSFFADKKYKTDLSKRINVFAPESTKELKEYMEGICLS